MNNTATYDPNSDRLTIFGGFDSASCCNSVANDVWILTNANKKAGTRQWINVLPNAGTPNAPPPTAAASSVYDETTNQMIVFGGQVNGMSTSNLWILRNANGIGGTPYWVQPAASGGPPPPRQNHQAVYDPKSDTMIVVGGLQFTGVFPPPPLNDVWLLKGAAHANPVWVKLSFQNGLIPSPRHSFAVAYDILTDRLTIYGGCTDLGFSCLVGSFDLWVLKYASGRNPNELPTWQPITTYTDPVRRPTAYAQFASAAYDYGGNRLFVFGGRVDSAPPFGKFTSDTWVLNNVNGPGIPSWTRLTPGGTLPLPRGQSVAPNLYDIGTSRFLLFGGPGLNDTMSLLTH